LLPILRLIWELFGPARPWNTPKFQPSPWSWNPPYSMVSPKVPTTLVTPNGYPVSHHSHLWTKMAENGWKQVFNTYLQNLFSYTLNYSMGQQMVVNYSMVSPKVPTMFMTPYDYPIGHHSRGVYSAKCSNIHWGIVSCFWALGQSLCSLGKIFMIREKSWGKV
jgi:hypothetical protein